MPAVSYEQRTSAPVDRVWNYVQVISSWAAEIPGYVSHQEVDDDTSVWTIQGDVGALNRKVVFRVLVTERIEPQRISFTLNGVNENLSGSGSFTASAAVGRVAASVPEPAARSAWWRAKFTRLVRRIFRKTFDEPGDDRATMHSAAPEHDAPSTVLVFDLNLEAGGLMGPVVNTLIEPLLQPAAAQLAGNIARQVERGARESGHAAPLSPQVD